MTGTTRTIVLRSLSVRLCNQKTENIVQKAVCENRRLDRNFAKQRFGM